MKAVASLAGHTSLVCSVAFSPDGQHIVSGSADKLVKVWSVSGGKEVASLAGHTSYVLLVAFSPDGHYIVSGGWDKLVKVWSVSCGKEVASLAGHTSVVRSVAFSPDGQHIVSGSDDKLVKVWSVSARKEVASRGLGFFGRPQSRWATYCFWKWEWRQVGEGVVCVWLEGSCVAGWTRVLFVRSPSVQMGNILFLQVTTR
jgi:WD40 repeat protein